jgi:sortase (surface protein transpeptidase)
MGRAGRWRGHRRHRRFRLATPPGGRLIDALRLRLRSRWRIAAAGIVVLVALAVVVGILATRGPVGTAARADRNGNVAPATTAASASPEPSVTPVPSGVAAPLRVQVPAVGLDAAVVPITPTGGELDPPRLDRAYWIESYGSPGPDADNTVYLAGHSVDRGAAVFDPLFDQEAQTALVKSGDEVTITTDAGAVTYVVDETQRYPKSQLASEAEVWRIVPGRLVLITCFQRSDGGRSTDNLVVYATRA